MKTKYRWTIAFCVATPFLLLLVMFLAGGGHGTFVPIIALFPFAALGIMSKLHSEILVIALAIAQLPIYGIWLDVFKRKVSSSSLLSHWHLYISRLLFVQPF